MDHTPRELQSKKEKKEALTINDVSHMILHEDAHRIVFNKPAGVVMHGGHKQKENLSMHDYLQSYVEQKQISTSPTFRPSFGYRLDKDTSGVLIAAKTYDALQYINRIIRERKIEKRYETMLIGALPSHVTVRESLTKIYDKTHGRGKMVVARDDTDPQKVQSAHTEYECIQQYEHAKLGICSHVRVRIYTGRMHQIRVHAAHQGYPVLGDIIYGKPSVNRLLYKKVGISRHLLHCETYSFYDTIQDCQQSFTAPHSEDIQKVIG